jgi:dethiobiotin synthetase
MPHFFITAVGTEVGKTLVTTILGHQLTAQRKSVITLKPIVSGFDAEDPMSDPALILQSLGKAVSPESIDAITPWRFRAPISPHLAARQEGRRIELDEVIAFCRRHEKEGGYLLVEGAGGLMSPINDDATNLELIKALGYPVILVTGSYLGALSHTLTACETLKTRAIPIQAIIVSESTPSVGLVDTLDTLRAFTAPAQLILPLPRLSGSPRQKWTSAPALIDTMTPHTPGT